MDHVESIEVMDAENLDYPDASFDVVVAQYVVTAIPQPEKALDEFVRVVRPGGEIILTTRIGAERGLRGTIEEWLMPLTSRMGWRTEFPWARYDRAARLAAAGAFLADPRQPTARSALCRRQPGQAGAEPHIRALVRQHGLTAAMTGLAIHCG
jgi:phosphatidylethanolamine/phosphatidyl-N-methylethanolamine N-methyltransferase